MSLGWYPRFLYHSSDFWFANRKTVAIHADSTVFRGVERENKSFTMQNRWNCDQWVNLVSASQKFLAMSSPGPAEAEATEAEAKSSDNGMAKSVPELVFSHCSPPPPVM